MFGPVAAALLVAVPADPPAKVIPVSAELLVVAPNGPVTADEFAARGNTYLDQKLWHLAAQDFTAGLALDPRRADILADRFVAYYELGQPAEAAADLDAAIRTDPTYAVAYRRRATLALAREAGQMKVRSKQDLWIGSDGFAARRDIDEAIRLDPTEAKAFVIRGGMRMMDYDYPGAIRDTTEAIRLDTRIANGWSNRALARYRSGDSSGGAVRDADEGVRLAPGDPKSLFIRGLCRSAVGEWPGAIADLTDVIRIEPTHLGAISALAWVRATCPRDEFRDGREAVRLAERIHAANPGCQTAAVMAAAAAEVGDFTAAVRWQRQALDTDGSFMFTGWLGGYAGVRIHTDKKWYHHPNRRAKWQQWLAGYEARQPCRDPLHWTD